MSNRNVATIINLWLTKSRPLRSSFCQVRLLCSASVTDKVVVNFDKAGAATLALSSTSGDSRRFVVDQSQTLADLAENVRKEGITADAIFFQSATDGINLAQQSTRAWHALAYQPLQIMYDGKCFPVHVENPPTPSNHAQPETLTRLTDELNQRAETLRKELAPLDAKVQNMISASHRRTRVLTWVGLAYMSAQFGFLARMTWFEYSWDIVEPITYFVTYGTGLFFYAYYVVTRQEANFAQMFDRQQLITVHKRIAKAQFDLPKYNKLREELHDTENQIARIQRSVDYQILTHQSPKN